MSAGQWYSCLDPELAQLQMRARKAVHAHNISPPDKRDPMAPELRALFAQVAQNARIEAPFHCAYGMNITLGADVFLNAGCTIIDTATVHIGVQTLLGPGVQIYCANHHSDPDKRIAGLEIALPVHIGKSVWIGGAAIILPGVTIGDKAIIGADAVVTRDVPAGTTVMGNPAKEVTSRT